jgi:hypothetical protein
MKEHDVVVLTQSIRAHGLEAGDVGTIVYIAPDESAYLVEFMTLTGDTIAVLNLTPSQVRAVREGELATVRAPAG